MYTCRHDTVNKHTNFMSCTGLMVGTRVQVG